MVSDFNLELRIIKGIHCSDLVYMDMNLHVN